MALMQHIGVGAVAAHAPLWVRPKSTNDGQHRPPPCILVLDIAIASPNHLEGRLRAQRLRVAHGDGREAVDARPRQQRQRPRLHDARGRVVRQSLDVRRREPVQQPCVRR